MENGVIRGIKKGGTLRRNSGNDRAQERTRAQRSMQLQSHFILEEGSGDKRPKQLLYDALATTAKLSCYSQSVVALASSL